MNDAPVAVNDSADVNAGGSVVIDVLGNDTDVDGDVLEVTDIADVSPSRGHRRRQPRRHRHLHPAGRLRRAPGPSPTRAYDGEASSNVATVDITVFPVLCSHETVSDTDGDVIGAFTRLTDQFECKRYALDAVRRRRRDTSCSQPSAATS